MIISKKQIKAFKTVNQDRVSKDVFDSIAQTEPELITKNRSQPVEEFIDKAVELGIQYGLSTEKHLQILTAILLTHLSHIDEWLNTNWIHKILKTEEPGRTKLESLIEQDVALRSWS